MWRNSVTRLFAAVAATLLLLCSTIAAQAEEWRTTQDIIQSIASVESVEQSNALFVEIRRQADEGNAPAQTVLGLSYFEGMGVEQSFDEAVKWMEKAAAQNFVDAKALLGSWYANGLGIPRDSVKGAKWLLEAAELGDA
jgi:TPR repeat protein